jgi:ER-derived vesicles protein
MVTCSTLVIIRKYSDYAIYGLMGVVVTQALGYGLIFDLNFFLRNLSVIGGLLMVLSDSWVRKTTAFAGLPQIDEADRKMYFQLAGRVLLIFLFIGFVFSGQWSVWRVLVSLLGLVACVMVVVGFKAKFSATLLVVILSVFNVLVNNFWTVSLAVTHKGLVRANLFCSSTSTTPTRTLPSTTSSRSCLLLGGCCSWSTVALASSASTRRRRCIKFRKETAPNCTIGCR